MNEHNLHMKRTMPVRLNDSPPRSKRPKLTTHADIAGLTSRQEQRLSTVSLESIDLQDCLDETEEANGTNSTRSITELPDEVLAQAASFLNVGSLKSSRLVCRKFNRILSQDQAGWTNHCERLWSRKVHVSAKAKAMLTGNTTNEQGAQTNRSMKAYITSCLDARLRHEITRDELVYEPTKGNKTVWDFRFKASAGTQWTTFDPYWSGLPCRKMVFLPDGRVRQVVEEVVLDVDNPDNNEIVRSFRRPFHDTTDPNGTEMQWRFVEQPLDFPKKKEGAYIRLTVDGRDIPTYAVHRDPTNSWGFILQNCWGVFASFPLPSKRVTTFDRALRDAHQESRQAKRQQLLEDSSLSVNSKWQWREAMLYNLGWATLPDGPSAAEEFKRAWIEVRSLGMAREEISRRFQSWQN